MPLLVQSQEIKQNTCNYVVYVHTCSCTQMDKNQTPAAVRQWFRATVQQLWPVATGSLTLRKGPCIRERCLLCASGEGHTSYALYARRGRKRISIYVPERLVPEIRAAIENGRMLQELINEAGLRYVKALKNRQRGRSGE